MQRLAFFSFIGVIVLLLAFTAHLPEGKAESRRPCKERVTGVTETTTANGTLAVTEKPGGAEGSLRAK